MSDLDEQRGPEPPVAGDETATLRGSLERQRALGLMAGQLLAEQGHVVVLHARTDARAADARAALLRAEAVLVGDLSTLAAMRDVAEQANASDGSTR